jgi:hypothetical protein
MQSGKPNTNEKSNLNELLANILKSNDITFVQYIFLGFILIGIILKYSTVSMYSTNAEEIDNLQKLNIVPVGPATGSIWGYTIILIGCLGLIFIGIKPTESNTEQMQNIPYGMYGLIIVLLWNIIINMRFYSSINRTPNMPSQYNTWNNWGTITVVILAVLTSITFLIKSNKNSLNITVLNNYKYQINLFMIIVFFISLIVLGIQQSILENFLAAG